MKRLIYFLNAVLILQCCGRSKTADKLPLIEGHHVISGNGMVVSAHPQASATGAIILEKGGNAVDAAVATGFALAVCYPAAGNIGGGGFMVVRMASGETDIIDYREKAPLKASRDMYLDSSGNVIEGLSTDSHLAAGVPGAVDGMVTIHSKYGKLSFAEVIEPSIELARNGFILTQEQASSLNYNKDIFLSRNKAKTAFVKQTPWHAGDTLKQPELAETLELIRDNGRDGFYKGKTADRIINEMKRGNGAISLSDLQDYRSIYRDPLINEYKKTLDINPDTDISYMQPEPLNN